MPRPRRAPLTEMQKLAKAIGDDGESIIQELEASDAEGLDKRIAVSTESMADTKRKLNETPEYIQVKNDKKLLESGLREVNKRQNAIIKVCLQMRRDRGLA